MYAWMLALALHNKYSYFFPRTKYPIFNEFLLKITEIKAWNRAGNHVAHPPKPRPLTAKPSSSHSEEDEETEIPTRAGPSRVGPSRVGPSRAGSSRAGSSRAGPSRENSASVARPSTSRQLNAKESPTSTRLSAKNIPSKSKNSGQYKRGKDTGRPAFSLAVSQHMHKITNLWKFELNWSSKLRDNNGRKKHPCHKKLCAFRCLISRPQNLILRSRNQIRGKLLLSRYCFTSEGAVSHNVLYYQPLPITRYQVRFYANSYFE